MATIGVTAKSLTGIQNRSSGRRPGRRPRPASRPTSSAASRRAVAARSASPGSALPPGKLTSPLWWPSRAGPLGQDDLGVAGRRPGRAATRTAAGRRRGRRPEPRPRGARRRRRASARPAAGRATGTGTGQARGRIVEPHVRRVDTASGDVERHERQLTSSPPSRSRFGRRSMSGTSSALAPPAPPRRRRPDSGRRRVRASRRAPAR